MHNKAITEEMNVADIDYIEGYRRGFKKLEFQWRYIDHIIDDLKTDNVFKQYPDLIDLLEYAKKGTNRIKLGGRIKIVYSPVYLYSAVP